MGGFSNDSLKRLKKGQNLNHLFKPELVTVVVVDAFFIAVGLVDDIPE